MLGASRERGWRNSIHSLPHIGGLQPSLRHLQKRLALFGRARGLRPTKVLFGVFAKFLCCHEGLPLLEHIVQRVAPQCDLTG